MVFIEGGDFSETGYKKAGKKNCSGGCNRWNGYGHEVGYNQSGRLE
jgi:hypothetical protein